MKTLDIFFRRHRLPAYRAGPLPRPAEHAFLLLTELRYESFDTDCIRTSATYRTSTETQHFLTHIGIFLVLNCLPQLAVFSALKVLTSIYLIWTALQLLLRYKTSLPLFGPIWKADSIVGFWTETWHNVFTPPCKNVIYDPTYSAALQAGLPKKVARALGCLGAFVGMGFFHVHVMWPVLSNEGLWRVWWFFALNGVLYVGESAVWGRQKHWIRTVMAWVMELSLASWTVESFPTVQLSREGLCSIAQ